MKKENEDLEKNLTKFQAQIAKKQDKFEWVKAQLVEEKRRNGDLVKVKKEHEEYFVAKD